jgi:cytochrome P450
MRDPSLSRSQLDSGSAFSPGRPFQSFGQALQYLSYRLTYFLLSHPYPFRIVFAVLRHVRPIATFGSMVMVSKASDVREVLDRLDDFTLNEILGAKMPWGPFLLTIDPPEQHARERQILESVVFRDADVQRIRRLAADRCSDIIKTKQADGEVDVVADLCDDIIVDLISSYFGIPVIDDKKSMARILGDVAGYILAEPPADSEPWVRSHDSMAKLTKAVVAQIERRAREHAAAPAAPAPEDDLLTRLVKVLCSGRGPAWLDQDWIRRYVTGLAATGGATIVRATTHAMDQLIAHPVGLQTARQLAAQIQTGRDADTDRRRLLGTIFEALRFRPMLPLLVRHSPRETAVAKGTDRARTVPAGGTVVTAPIAAMFDPEAFENPGRFVTDRSLDGYVHFGHGPRLCFGKYVAETVIVEIVRSLVLLPGLKRAPWPNGGVRYDGPVARSLRLRFS